MRKLFFLAAAAAAFCQSCTTSLLGNPTDKAETYAKALEIVRRNIDPERFKIYYLSFSEEDKLSDNLYFVIVKMVNKDDQAFTQTLFMNGMQPSELRTVQHTFEAPTFEGTKGLDPDQIDPAKIAGQIAEAVAALPEGHSFKSVGDYTIQEEVPAGVSSFTSTREVGNQKTTFVVRFTEDGKETESSAGRTSTIYYEARATVEPDGTITIKEN